MIIYSLTGTYIKGIKMYRKGEMRYKNYKRVKEGGGGMARDRQ